MESVGVILLLFILGATLGSFGCCQAWRIHKNDKSKWSHCMKCKYQLQWYDNIPIISWVALGGKCRKCRKPIGYSEILSEVGLGLAFVATFWWWPSKNDLVMGDFAEVLKFGLFLVNLVLLLISFVYDAKWKELPVGILIASSVLALAFLGVDIFTAYGVVGSFDWLSLGGAIVILPVFYYLMYKVSKERWVGGGDWILCVPLALVLENFWLALFALFISNIIGSVISLPILIRVKNRKMTIPFGPFLILGFLVVFFLQSQILQLITV
ncbi:prepilin peptidase [Candidatus Saccharibacteria bacterium]|nr:prepilin peptidase [Candidatus Saccharibacteria bacterium]